YTSSFNKIFIQNQKGVFVSSSPIRAYDEGKRPLRYTHPKEYLAYLTPEATLEVAKRKERIKLLKSASSPVDNTQVIKGLLGKIFFGRDAQGQKLTPTMRIGALEEYVKISNNASLTKRTLKDLFLNEYNRNIEKHPVELRVRALELYIRQLSAISQEKKDAIRLLNILFFSKYNDMRTKEEYPLPLRLRALELYIDIHDNRQLAINTLLVLIFHKSDVITREDFPLSLRLRALDLYVKIGDFEKTLSALARIIEYEQYPSEMKQKARWYKEKLKQGISSSPLTTDAPKAKYYFETLIKLNLKLIELTKFRKNAALQEEASKEIEKLIQELKQLIKRGIGSQAKERLNRAIEWIEKKNEPAANALLAQAATLFLEELSLLFKNRPAGKSRKGLVWYDAGKGKFMVVRGQNKKYEIADGASTIFREYKAVSYNYLWEALRAVDDETNTEIKELLWLRQVYKQIRGINKRLDAAKNKEPALSKEELAGIAQQLAKVHVELDRALLGEKDIIRYSLDLVVALLGIGELTSARTILGVTLDFVQARGEAVKRIIEKIQAGRLAQLRKVAKIRNNEILNRINNIVEVLKKGDTDAAYRKIQGLLRLKRLARCFTEPEFWGLRQRLGQAGSESKKQNTQKARAIIESVREKIKEAQLLGEFMQRYRDRYVQTNLKKGQVKEISQEEIFGWTFEQFIQKAQLNKGSPEADLWWTKFYRAAFIPLRIKDPQDKNKRIINPTFLAITDLIFLKESFRLAAFPKELKKRRPQLKARLLDFTERGRTNYYDLNPSEKEEWVEAFMDDYFKVIPSSSKIIIFDLDGVILDIIPLLRECLAHIYLKITRAIADNQEFSPTQEELKEAYKYWKEFALGRPFHSVISQIVKLVPQPLKSADAYYADYVSLRQERIEERLKGNPRSLLMADVEEVLSALKDRCYLLYIASAASKGRLKILAANEIISYFEEIYIVERLDEKIKTIEKIITQNNLSPSQAAVIDDASFVIQKLRNKFKDLFIIGMSKDKEERGKMAKANRLIANLKELLEDKAGEDLPVLTSLIKSSSPLSSATGIILGERINLSDSVENIEVVLGKPDTFARGEAFVLDLEKLNIVQSVEREVVERDFISRPITAENISGLGRTLEKQSEINSELIKIITQSKPISSSPLDNGEAVLSSLTVFDNVQKKIVSLQVGRAAQFNLAILERLAQSFSQWFSIEDPSVEHASDIEIYIEFLRGKRQDPGELHLVFSDNLEVEGYVDLGVNLGREDTTYAVMEIAPWNRYAIK
ncbi:MAG: HAD hydrolase-like protein, partial [Candidatus Omnitrophica bacterium]|nr:HAD hydrolase-like protein [Candidatus Omnitrophota bacterium]